MKHSTTSNGIKLHRDIRSAKDKGWAGWINAPGDTAIPVRFLRVMGWNGRNTMGWNVYHNVPVPAHLRKTLIAGGHYGFPTLKAAVKAACVRLAGEEFSHLRRGPYSEFSILPSRQNEGASS